MKKNSILIIVLLALIIFAFYAKYSHEKNREENLQKIKAGGDSIVKSYTEKVINRNKQNKQ